MKVAAVILALAGVGYSGGPGSYSSVVCRDLTFVTGSKCSFAFSNSDFKIMPFDKPVPKECNIKVGADCDVEVCGTQAQFAQNLEVVSVGRANSWSFDLYVDNELVTPTKKCTSSKPAFCCGMQMRIDGKTKKASYEWPEVESSNPTPAPSMTPAPTSALSTGTPTGNPTPAPSTAKPSTANPTGSPTPAPSTAVPTSAPTRGPTRSPTAVPTSTDSPTAVPTSTDAPTTTPSRSPTMKVVTLAPTMPKPCKFMNKEECDSCEFCKAKKSRGKKVKAFACVDVKCKKFNKNVAKCEEAHNCKPGKIIDGKMLKCLKNKM